MLQICLALYQEYIVLCTLDCIDSIDTGGLLLLQYLCVFLLEVFNFNYPIIPIIPEINFPYHKVLPRHSPFFKEEDP